ncbi:hypothetical protein ACVDG3_18165 [Meridianimarinicoccus sp. RP-17]|uniref:hypothetical protein n=1 Tax=Meridianimarinicoccus zhengii TaxID=2056810 RepID=UPI000DAD4774|nr:hypothetical protein [Phycocomes zhengii]
MPDPVIAIGMNALSVAMKAKCGQLTANDVADLVNDAGELLDSGQPVRIAVTTFATGYELYAHDPAYLRTLGVELHEAVARAVQPDPVDIHRRDIHG